MMPRITSIALPLGGAFFLLCVWAIVGVVSPHQSFIATPIGTLRDILLLTEDERLFSDLAATAKRWLAGFATASLIGIPIGLLVGSSRLLGKSTSFIFEFARSLPVTAMFPMFIIAFGIGDVANIAMVFIANIFIIIMATAYGVSSAPKTRNLMAISFGANRLQRFVFIDLFEAIPHILIGMRTALSLALIVAIVSEMLIGVRFGLGQRIFMSYQLQQIDRLYALVLISGVMGYLANVSFSWLSNRAVFWIGEKA